MRDVLVTLDAIDARGDHVGYAAELCAAFGAALTGLLLSQPFADMPPIESPAMLPDAVRFLREYRRAAMAGGPAFVAWATGRGVEHSDWRIGNGSIAAVLAELGNWHDLIVTQAPAAGDALAFSQLGQILLGVEPACLVLPAGIRWQGAPQRIAVAWNDSPQAIRAISAARPLLERASHVIVLGDILRRHAGTDVVHPAFDLKSYFTRQGYAVEYRPDAIDDSHAGESLLAAATQMEADLLVMGGYGRARFSEWVLGGATRHVLQHATLPVLIRH